jgi:hypothetical protein
MNHTVYIFKKFANEIELYRRFHGLVNNNDNSIQIIEMSKLYPIHPHYSRRRRALDAERGERVPSACYRNLHRY